jgi:hypothetical protein
MNDRNERLRAILRKGDPAAGDPGLPAEELQAMRRAMLSAVPEPRRRGWLVPVLAAAAVLALATALALGLWRTESRPEPLAIARPVQPTPSPRPPAVQVPAAPEAPVRTAEKTEGVERPRKRRTPRPAPPAPEPVRTVVAQHQIQFSTPGGTRVIWVPNPTAE